MDTPSIIALVGLPIAVLVAFVPTILKRLSDNPKLEVELKYSSGSSSPRGASNKNEVRQELVDGRLMNVIDGNNMIQHFELKWKYELIIRNASEYTAYDIHLKYATDSAQLSSLEALNSLKPIEKHKEISLNGEFIKWEECRGSERTNVSRSLPEELKKMKIVLNYKNQHNHSFYTHFDLINGKGKNSSGRI